MNTERCDESYVFKVIIEPDKFEDGRETWHTFCPALKGCHIWGHRLSDSFPTGTLRAMIADPASQDEDLQRLGLAEQPAGFHLPV